MVLVQVTAAEWRTACLLKSSAALDAFELFRKDWAIRKQAWAKKYKGRLTTKAALADKATLDKELETKMIAYGFYKVKAPDAGPVVDLNG